jgi:hypothetical protein
MANDPPSSTLIKYNTMNKMAKISGVILSGLLVVGAASSARGQTGPAGDFQLSVTEASSIVWDLSAIDAFHHAGIEVEDPKKEGRAELDFLTTPILGAGGKISGAGQTTVSLGVETDLGWETITFPGTYKLSASISSSKGVAKGSSSVSVSGTAQLEGKARALKASSSTSFTVNNSAKTVSGSMKSSASASGLGSISGKDTFGPNSMVTEGAGDGTWTLLMTLSTTGKVVTGSQAKVTLSSGRILSFTAKGTFTAKTQATKLVLTGTGDAKGSSLQIGLAGSQIKTVKGKLLGQTVGLTL